MPFFDKITKATQDVVKGAKDFTDTARQNSLIADEKRQIENWYAQIGKLYYETHEANDDTPIGKLCMAINASNERIGQYNEEIRKIKGTKCCPSCNAELPLAAPFCAKCGTPVAVVDAPDASGPAGKVNCTCCGAELDGGVAFCTSCGQKL